jgi:hypothetical protein
MNFARFSQANLLKVGEELVNGEWKRRAVSGTIEDGVPFRKT